MMMYLIPSASDSLKGGLSCWAASAVAQLASPWQPQFQEDTWPAGGTQQQVSPSFLPRKASGQWASPQNTDSRWELTGWSPLVPTVSPHQKALSSPTLPGKLQLQQLLRALRNTKGRSGDQADLSRGREVEAAFHSLQDLSCSFYQGGSNRKRRESYSSSHHGLTSLDVGHHIHHPCGKCCAVL